VLQLPHGAVREAAAPERARGRASAPRFGASPRPAPARKPGWGGPRFWRCAPSPPEQEVGGEGRRSWFRRDAGAVMR
jgi:hypothetical protein